ncbi:VanZ family protein [Halanaerobium saccharolyticum]|uniref:VanZ family protein n=1 Tax=Halanaerobium saccharolyticum TaxID=43595 RepID=A0A4R6LNP3_9FIRM|nr:VanZ family protein [Halanaerobium saccharolyticum]TDO84329.1 VanZ family protein [Halanaerobium saccharolyticum]
MIRKMSAWIFVVIWMGLIFNFSAQNGAESSRMSQGISKKLYELFNNLPLVELEFSFFHSFIRQAAHFFVFFVLALLLINAFRMSGVVIRYSIFYTLLIAVIYAALDEYHQSFVPGRAAELKDIFTDTLGILVGVGFYRTVIFIFNFF